MTTPDEPTVPNLPPTPGDEPTQAFGAPAHDPALDPDAAAEGDRSMRNGLIGVGALIALVLIALLAVALRGGDSDQDLTAGDASSTTTSSSTTSTTEEPTTTTEEPTTTTAVPAVTVAPTTTTMRPTTTTTFPPGSARVTYVNEYPGTVVATLNGATKELKPGERFGPFAVMPAANNNDVVQVHVKDDPSCGVGDADDKLDADKSYTLTVTNTGAGGCAGGKPGIGFRMSSP